MSVPRYDQGDDDQLAYIDAPKDGQPLSSIARIRDLGLRFSVSSHARSCVHRAAMAPLTREEVAKVLYVDVLEVNEFANT